MIESLVTKLPSEKNVTKPPPEKDEAAKTEAPVMSVSQSAGAGLDSVSGGMPLLTIFGLWAWFLGLIHGSLIRARAWFWRVGNGAPGRTRTSTPCGTRF